MSEPWRHFHLNFVCTEGSVAGDILGSISYGHTRGYGEEIWEPGKTMNGCTASLPCIPQLHATPEYPVCTCLWQINKAEAKRHNMLPDTDRVSQGAFNQATVLVSQLAGKQG